MHRDACIVFNVHTVKKKFKFYSTYRIGILKVVLLDTPQVIVKVARLVLLVAKKLHSLVRLVVLLVVLVMVVVVSVVAGIKDRPSDIYIEKIYIVTNILYE